MSKHYKDFTIYVNGIKNIIEILNKQDKYVLRIFIDENIRNDIAIFNLLNSNKKIEIVVFKCNHYLNKNGFHVDVFGTFVRFFPLFNFENNDAGNVILIDIDLDNRNKMNIEYLLNFNTTESEIVGKGYVINLLSKNINPHYFAGVIGFFNIQFDKKLIIDFIQNIDMIKNNSFYNKRNKPFSYGTDELFLNKYFIYNKDNTAQFKTGILIDYNINYFLYHYKDTLLKEYPKNTNKYLKYILGEKSDKNIDNKKMFDLIDKIVYRNKNINKQKILSIHFYNLITYLYKNKKIWFTESIINVLYEYFLHIISSNSVIYFNKNNQKIINVEHYNKILI